MASRLESLSRPNGVTLFLNSLPLNKKNNITISLKELEFAEVTHDVRGIGERMTTRRDQLANHVQGMTGLLLDITDVDRRSPLIDAGRSRDVDPAEGLVPKLHGPGEARRDFVLEESAPGLVHLVGIESPGLTASEALADEVAALLFG